MACWTQILISFFNLQNQIQNCKSNPALDWACPALSLPLQLLLLALTPPQYDWACPALSLPLQLLSSPSMDTTTGLLPAPSCDTKTIV